jgi:hypothetical protein
MTHSKQHGFATHENCTNFRSEYCSVYGIVVNPDSPACPNFTPKSIIRMPQKARTYPEVKQPCEAYAPRIQSHQSRMLPYPPQTAYNFPSSNTRQAQNQYGHRKHYSSTQVPSAAAPTLNGVGFTLISSRVRSGVGAGGGGRGRMGGFATGPSGSCKCPKCGYSMPHVRGIPCYQQTCPKCGSRMTRGA